MRLVKHSSSPTCSASRRSGVHLVIDGARPRCCLIRTSQSIDFKDLEVRVYGGTALVKGDVDFRNNAAGVVTVSKLNLLHVLVKGPQGWQLVARQATRYPDPAPAGKK